MVRFDEVKRVTTIDRVAAWLGFSGTRMQCPVNKGDKRELAIFPKTQTFCCYGCRKPGMQASEYSGDLIQFAAHVKQTKVKHEAVEIMEKFHGYKPTSKGLPSSGLPYLEPHHDAVKLLGFNTTVAEEYGIGFANKGTMRGYILVPIRNEKGDLKGYLGFPPGTEIKLPKDFKAP